MAREISLYETPKTLETAGVLDNSVLEAYNDSVKSAYNSEKARRTLLQAVEANGEWTGSNPFMLVHLQNSGLINGRIATRQDLETALRLGLDLSKNYVDFGLALRTAGDSYSPNDLPARVLAEQLKDKGIKLGKGKFFPVSALRLREDLNSAYGLLFYLKEDAQVDDLSSQKWNYTGEQGLARACLYVGGDWYSYVRSLGYSGTYGRVVVVGGEATAKNILDSKLRNLQKQRDSEIAKINERYARAEKVLRGKNL